ncbi:unnamed protein product [Prunus armeniaca]|uniref:Uncharacterized protein n=1 Tax=Prunus armeniaca TaxID=36596 RepID=A0A6J5XJ73_PRUAR|nr:unnamed protein product [Prunus armeniaca]
MEQWRHPQMSRVTKGRGGGPFADSGCPMKATFLTPRNDFILNRRYDCRLHESWPWIVDARASRGRRIVRWWGRIDFLKSNVKVFVISSWQRRG